MDFTKQKVAPKLSAENGSFPFLNLNVGMKENFKVCPINRLTNERFYPICRFPIEKCQNDGNSNLDSEGKGSMGQIKLPEW